MRAASGDIISAGSIERTDRARGQTWFVRTGITRTRSFIARRQIHYSIKPERAAPRMPQTKVGMNEHPHRRRAHGLGLLRPPNERHKRRCEREEGARAQIARQRGHNAVRPTIERALAAVAIFRRGGKPRPLRAADKAKHDNHARRRTGRPVFRVRMKSAAKGKPACLGRGLHIIQRHMFRRYLPPTSKSVSEICPSEQ